MVLFEDICDKQCDNLLHFMASIGKRADISEPDSKLLTIVDMIRTTQES